MSPILWKINVSPILWKINVSPILWKSLLWNVSCTINIKRRFYFILFTCLNFLDGKWYNVLSVPKLQQETGYATGYPCSGQIPAQGEQRPIQEYVLLPLPRCNRERWYPGGSCSANIRLGYIRYGHDWSHLDGKFIPCIFTLDFFCIFEHF